MAFKLMMEAQKRWCRIRGYQEISLLLADGVYKDGILVNKAKASERVR